MKLANEFASRYFASPAAPAHRQPCRCSAYSFPHRPLSGACRELPGLPRLSECSVVSPMAEERAAFDACEARAINRDYR